MAGRASALAGGVGGVGGVGSVVVVALLYVKKGPQNWWIKPRCKL
jgi:hypothetical protein